MSSSTILRFPDFLCIGAQKAGTTWLHKELNQHPDVWMPPYKEVQYFNRVHPATEEQRRRDNSAHDANRTANMLNAMRSTLSGRLPAGEMLNRVYCLSLIAHADRNDEWYGRIFGLAPDSAVCGEASPDYALLPDDGIDHILQLQRDCRFIFVIRDPIERAWSYLRMSERQRGAEVKLSQISTRASFAYSDYMRTIDRYRHKVAADNFLLLYFDEIENSPVDLLRRVCSFIGVDPDRATFKNAAEPANAGHKREMDEPTHAEFLRVFAPIYERLRRLESPMIESWFKRHYERSSPGNLVESAQL